MPSQTDAKAPHYTLTFSGAAQSLQDAIAQWLLATFKRPGTEQELAKYNIACRQIILQPDGANGAACYFGGDSSVTSSDHGFRLEAGATLVPPAPFIYELSGTILKPADIWVIGTAAQKLHIQLVSL